MVSTAVFLLVILFVQFYRCFSLPNNPCRPNPCGDSETCLAVRSRGGLVSFCLPPDDPCYGNPCLGNGTCTSYADGSFNCSCEGNLMGDRCQLEDPCIPNPCEDSQTCQAIYTDVNQLTSLCLASVADDPCSSNPCLNNGTCTSTDDENYNCSCTSDWLGDRCQMEDPCASNPCDDLQYCLTIYTDVNQLSVYCEDSGILISCPDGSSDVFCASLDEGSAWGSPSPNVEWSVENETWIISFTNVHDNTGSRIDMPSLDDYIGTVCLKLTYSIEGSSTLDPRIFSIYNWDIQDWTDIAVSTSPVNIEYEFSKTEAVGWDLGFGKFQDGSESWKLSIYSYVVEEGECSGTV